MKSLLSIFLIIAIIIIIGILAFFGYKVYKSDSSKCTRNIKIFGQVGDRPTCFFLLYLSKIINRKSLGGNLEWQVYH